jgi:hypothetical protein
MFTTLMVLLIVLVAGSAMAGAKLTINDDAYVDLGYRLQTYWQSKDMNLDPATDGYENARDFSIRRARFRVKGVITPKVSVFLQTDLAGGSKSMEMIDAFVNYKADPWAQFIMGRNMAPSSRQALTSSGALMALDRPGQTGNALNWRTSGVDATPSRVRDDGLTLFGAGPLGDGSLKYYVGVYNGVHDAMSVDDKDHIAFRAQYNLWDAEGSYYNSSTYLGKKKTLGLGFSYDTQAEVGNSSAPVVSDPDILVDYTLMAVDAFLELPSSNGSALTAEFGWNSVDFDDAVDYTALQGTGFYGQAGYYMTSGVQPWFLYEAFSSDAAAIVSADPNFNGKVPGDYSAYRFGLTYFIDGHNANIKLAYEAKTMDVPTMVGATAEDTVNTITLGFFTTY